MADAQEDVNIGLVGSHKTVAEMIKAADRIPFQIFQTHRQAPFIRDRERMSRDPRPHGNGSNMAAPGVVPLLHLADLLHRRDQARRVLGDEF